MNKLFENILRKLGWVNCPECNELIKPKWVKDWIYHSEEPPIFYHYECPKCPYKTIISPTYITENAVKKLGFKNFNEYYEKIIREENI